jgi:hypothetical protein
MGISSGSLPGFQKYSVVLGASVFLWQRIFVHSWLRDSKDSKIQVFKDSKIQEIPGRLRGRRIPKIFCGFLCFCVFAAKNIRVPIAIGIVAKKIQKFNSAKAGIGFQKIFCGFLCFCVLVATKHSCPDPDSYRDYRDRGLRV